MTTYNISLGLITEQATVEASGAEAALGEALREVEKHAFVLVPCEDNKDTHWMVVNTSTGKVELTINKAEPARKLMSQYRKKHTELFWIGTTADLK
jgi:hypothetical protein